MARHVFFSFHYERDVWRASIVRNSWVTQDRTAPEFWDKSLWEEAKRKGDTAIRQMIDTALSGTSVTAVLIGPETAMRPWVKYEIEKSIKIGNGLVGIHISGIRDSDGLTDGVGANPLDDHVVKKNGLPFRANMVYKTYDWVLNRGYDNLGSWVEEAARIARR
jgi:hypothetical protein